MTRYQQHLLTFVIPVCMLYTEPIYLLILTGAKCDLQVVQRALVRVGYVNLQTDLVRRPDLEAKPEEQLTEFASDRCCRLIIGHCEGVARHSIMNCLRIGFRHVQKLSILHDV